MSVASRVGEAGPGADTLWAVSSDLFGISTWLLIAVVIATRLFKWEVV
jgi:hypothetical protein